MLPSTKRRLGRIDRELGLEYNDDYKFYYGEGHQKYLWARVADLEQQVALLMDHLNLERCDKPATKTLCKKKGAK